jgi:flagellar basal-body rod protein FlgG
MIQSLYTAASGLSGQQRRIDIIANNISNVNTTAYKSSSSVFKDTLYTTMENPEDTGGGLNLQRGTGITLSATTLDHTQGNIRDTGGELDFAIDGEGFFKLLDLQGNAVYTRDGSFYRSISEDGEYLVNSQGCYVLDENDEKISLPENAEDISVSADGTLTAGDRTLKLGIYEFPNGSGLLSVGNNLFSESLSSGGPVAAEGFAIRQGALESSNVDLATELTKLMRAQRVFSLSSRALQTADNMEGLANNIRR